MDRSRNLTLHRSLLTLCLISCTCSGQIPSTAGVAAAGYTSPFPLLVAPGQLVTMYLQGPGASSVSAAFWNQKAVEAAPVLQVSPWSSACVAPPNSTCANGVAVTVQIPFDAPDSVIAVEPSGIAFSLNGAQSGYFGVQAQPDRVHILTSCDTIVGGGPCAPLILHGNGQQVSYLHPASSGEELVAYATGLGQTNPPLATGVPASQSSPADSSFNMDFNYRPNALATQPAFTPANPPLFAGSTQGFVGLYQINFVVPPPPVSLQPCSGPVVASGPIGGLVLSNLTVSVGSLVSFHGAGICVTPNS